MIFKKLTIPTLFIASPGDVTKIREALLITVPKFAGSRLKPYAWEEERSKSGFDQWGPVAEQIPLPSDPFCKVVECIFGERLGSPMVNASSYTHLLGPEELLRPANSKYRLETEWKPGLEETGAFPLTGTVFEVLVALDANARKQSEAGSKKGNPALQVWFVGDSTVLEALRSDDVKIEEANWGNHLLFEQTMTKLKPGKSTAWEKEYLSQLKQLRNFGTYLLQRGVSIDETSIVVDREDAVGKCKEFLRSRGYRDTSHNSFKGLNRYDFSDHDVLRGRDDWVDEALRVFTGSWLPTAAPFYGIVGGSGVGKSSLLHAGVLARLQNRGYKIAILEADDLKPSRATTATDNLPGTPLSIIVQKALYGICVKQLLDEEKGEIISIVAEPDRDRTAAVIRHLSDTLERQAYWAVEKIKEELDRVGGEQLRLVIGLDQFEEVLDERTNGNTAFSRELGRMFDFIVEACRSGRIGFVYTCQNNRLDKLAADSILGSLVSSEFQDKVEFWTGNELRRMIRQMFDDVYIDLSIAVIKKLCDQVDRLELDIRNSDAQFVAADEIRATLLPLLSLTLLHFYEYCDELRQKNKRLRKDFTSASGEGTLASGNNAVCAEKSLQADDPVKAAVTQQSSDDDDTSFPLDLKDIDERTLDVENAVRVQATKALDRARDWPGTAWSPDVLDSLLRRLVRIDGKRPGHYNLLSIPIPRKGVEKVLVESLRDHRLLIPVGRDEVRLVHESVIKYWPDFSTWLGKEERLLKGYQEKLLRLIDDWDRSGRSPAVLQPLDPEVLSLAGEFLRGWWDVFRPADGTAPSTADQLLCDFSLAVLEVAMKPDGIVGVGDQQSTHFLTAVNYGRKDLILRYLKSDPDAALNHRSSKQSGAAYSAAFSGDVSIMEIVLDHRADPAQKNDEGWQAIHAAAHLGNIEILNLLVNRGVDPDVIGAGGRTSLQLAAANDQREMVRHLLEVHNAKPNTQDPLGYTTLLFACQYASLETVEVLLKHSGVDTSLSTNDGWQALHLACRNRNAEMVRLLMQQGSTDPGILANGWSPLHLAILNKSPINKSHEIVRALLADPRTDRSAQTPTNKNVVELAVDDGRVEVLEALLDDPLHQINPDGEVGKSHTPLVEACSERKLDLIRVLVAGGADVNAAYLPMCQQGDLRILNLLLERADYRKTDDQGRTGLHLAALGGHTEIVKTLVARCDPEALDRSGATALHLTVAAGFSGPAETLVRHSPSLLDIPDSQGRRVAHIAATYGYVQILDALEDFNILVNDAQGMSPLHYAARFGQVAFIQRLLESVDVNVSDEQGWTPLHVAAQNGQVEAVNLLLKNGADPSIPGKHPSLSPWLAAVAAGQTRIVELLMPKHTKREKRQALLDEAMFLAVRNAQFETALRLVEVMR